MPYLNAKLTELPSQMMVIKHDGMPIVITHYSPLVMPSAVLDQYAKNYAFNRKKLSYSIVQSVSLSDVLDEGIKQRAGIV